MFSENKKNKSNDRDRTKEQNKIAQGTKITGNIVASGSFRIEGTLEGTLKTAGKIVVGKTGYLDGEIECESADFEGKFSGKLSVSETLTLRSTALIDGEVFTNKLSVEPGATFNASCTMKGGIKSLKDGKQRQAEEKTQKERSA